MSVYGVGAPRSGTKMLAACLSVVRPTPHEAARGSRVMWPLIRDAVIECAQGGTSFRYLGEREVAWYLTFAEPPDHAVHLWRPYGEWLRSMERRGILGRGAWMLGSDDPEWVWAAYNRRALSLPRVYTVQPGEIRWEPLLEWLGWSASPDQRARMREIQASRPNRSGP